MKKMSLSSWIVGIIVMLATGIIWWLGLKDLSGEGMFWLCLGTILGLELVTTLLFSITLGDPRLVGRAVSFLMETVLMINVSVLYVNLFRDAFESYLIILVSLTAICLVFAVWMTGNYRKNTRDQQQVQAAQEQMWRCQNVVSIMQCYENAGKYREQLDRLEDDLRYTLRSTNTELDELIYGRLCLLAEQVQTDGADAQKLFTELRNLLRRRSELAKR